MNKQIVIISSHADDHVMFAGTLFKLQHQGYELSEIVLTTSHEGVDKRTGAENHSPQALRELRASEFDKASKFLGLKHKYFFNEEDLNLRYSKHIMLGVVQVIRELQPEIVITLHKSDYHRDHRAAAKITREAVFWSTTGIRKDLGLAHRTPTTLYSEGLQPQKIDVLVDVTPFHQKKLELFCLYESQADEETMAILKSLMITRGYHLNNRETIEYAEGFALESDFPNIMFG